MTQSDAGLTLESDSLSLLGSRDNPMMADQCLRTFCDNTLSSLT